jgi:hypothetical protein
MHESLRLLDEAAAIAVGEIRALDAQDEERLQKLCDRRAALINEAWERREGCDPARLADALGAIRKIQQSLTAQAKSRSLDLQDALRDSKQESTRINGYRRVTAQGGGPLYLSRMS